jgi:hypothetical protein
MPDKEEKRWSDFRTWVESSLDLETSRLRERMKEGNSAREERQKGYRDALEDVLGMVYAFDREAKLRD